MKKAVLVALTLIISVAFTTGVFAQATSEPQRIPLRRRHRWVRCPVRWLQAKGDGVRGHNRDD